MPIFGGRKSAETSHFRRGGGGLGEGYDAAGF